MTPETAGLWLFALLILLPLAVLAVRLAVLACRIVRACAVWALAWIGSGLRGEL